MKMVSWMMLFTFVSFSWLAASEVHDAARDGDVETLSAILERDPAQVNACDERNSTPLHFACDKGHRKIAALLIEAGADLSMRDVDGDTPIYWAAYAGHDEVVALLIKHGSSVNDKNNNLFSPLHYAAMGSREHVAELLLKHGADIHAIDHEGYTALHIATMRDFHRMVRFLIAKGADLNRGDERDRTPLLLVARETGKAQMARTLLELGAELDAIDRYDDTALTLAAWRGFKELVDLFLDKGIKFDAKGAQGQELMGYACKRGLVRLFKVLVKKGADLDAAGAKGGTLLHLAATGGSAPIVKIVLDKGLAIDAVDRYGWTALHYAAKRGRLDATALLLSKGADADAASLAGQTAYSLASKWKHEKVVKLLEEKGASAKPANFPRLTGPYLGQQPPGMKPEHFAFDIVSSHEGEHGCVSFTPDGKEAYWSSFFTVSDAGYSRCAILSSRLGKEGWTAPEFAPFSLGLGIGDDVPFCTPDGKRVYFLTRRPTQPGGRPTKENIWFVERKGSGWSEPVRLPGEINNYDVHWQLSVSKKGTLYIGCGPLGICACPLVDGKHTKPVSVANAAGDDFSGGSPFIAPDESYLILSSLREEGSGGDDLYISFKQPDGEWGRPRNMGPGVNSDGHDLCPMVTPDGKYLFFLSRGNTCWVDAAWIEKLRAGSS